MKNLSLSRDMRTNNTNRTRLKWYVIKTQVGMESLVKKQILIKIRKLSLDKYIGQILTPIEISNIAYQTRDMTVKNCFPGYVIIKLQLSNKTSWVLRNTLGVIEIIKSGKIPLELRKKEATSILEVLRKINSPSLKIFHKYDSCSTSKKIVFSSFGGMFKEVHFDRKKIFGNTWRFNHNFIV